MLGARCRRRPRSAPSSRSSLASSSASPTTMITKPLALGLLTFLLASPAYSSRGDQAAEFRSCVSLCRTQICQNSAPELLPFSLRLTRWTCEDDCKYQCMHLVTDRAVEHGTKIEQYHGKWPFWRLAGMQEPASVLFSIFNFVAHAFGARKLRDKVPEEHPMKKYYLMFAFVSMNAWVWSSVFHTRGRLLLSAWW